VGALSLVAALVGAVLVSDLLARRVEVAGTVNFSGSDLYLIPAMALLGPIPAAVVAVGTELVMASTTRGMTSVKTFNNAVALGSYALAGGILIQGGAELAG
jgi:hypothetical protein